MADESKISIKGFFLRIIMLLKDFKCFNMLHSIKSKAFY